MGSYGTYTGSMTIPDEKKKEFNAAMEKILYTGGMMRFEKVKIYGKEIALLQPFQIKENEEPYFYYNYFEDDRWETASYNPVTCHLYSEKIGSGEFNNVIMAAYTLYELYDDGPGLAMNDDEPVIQSESYVAWINYLLKKEYSTKKYYRLWENMEYASDGNSNFLKKLINKKDKRYLGFDGTEYIDCYLVENGTGMLHQVLEENEKDTYLYMLAVCMNNVNKLLEENAQDNTNEIIKILRMSFDDRNAYSKTSTDENLQTIAMTSLHIPARMVVLFMISKLEEKGVRGDERWYILDKYWSHWRENKDSYYTDEKKLYHVEKAIQEKKEEIKSKKPTLVSTTEFLDCPSYFGSGYKEYPNLPEYYIDQFDCVYWCKDAILLSKNAKATLKECGDLYQEILNSEEVKQYDSLKYIEDFMTLLENANSIYKRIFCFTDVFYEFIHNCKEKEYIAALKFLEKVVETNQEYAECAPSDAAWWLSSRRTKFNPSRRFVKRIFAVMGNREIRKIYFNF